MFLSRITPWSRSAEQPSLAGFDAARRYFASHFSRTDPARERLFVAYLDASARCLHLARHEGDAAGIDWPLRSILLEGARRGCAGLIVAHNHPSGDSTPSAADLSATRRLATAGDAIGLTLVDHLLFAGDECASFRRMGLL
ncbi:JAB domain-containing protein [Sphingomonas sp.]|uniref:JAB domain-containing protein n=1 Tax=Sphingomonas sp. TaxID=28214 RepID=UPI0037529A49